jgi:hypothetical protein
MKKSESKNTSDKFHGERIDYSEVTDLIYSYDYPAEALGVYLLVKSFDGDIEHERIAQVLQLSKKRIARYMREFYLWEILPKKARVFNGCGCKPFSNTDY